MPHINVQYVCRAQREKKIDPKQRKHVLFQLKAEGHKRVAGFIFEKVFDQIISSCPRTSEYTTGWLFQENDRSKRYDWFRLVTPISPWNSLDERIVDFLLGVQCSVARIDYDYQEKEFTAIQFGLENTNGRLADILALLLKRKTPEKEPKNYGGTDRKQQKLALEFIDTLFTDSELESLSLSRTLINCYMNPWYGKQPMDIDAAITTEQGWSFVEFKRKYPAWDGYFGIDMEPHGNLVDWLDRNGQSLLHVILVDPLWDKHTSPVHLLSLDSVTIQHAIWLGMELNNSSYSMGQYTTSGADSGMTGGTRNQKKLSNKSFKILGTGMEPDHICSFFLNPASIPTKDPMGLLKQERDKARKAYYSKGIGRR
jgi:hypothetical protein